jgi:hypothetical protein
MDLTFIIYKINALGVSNDKCWMYVETKKREEKKSREEVVVF